MQNRPRFTPSRTGVMLAPDRGTRSKPVRLRQGNQDLIQLTRPEAEALQRIKGMFKVTDALLIEVSRISVLNSVR